MSESTGRESLFEVGKRVTTVEASVAADTLAAFAKGERDGCFAVSSEFTGSPMRPNVVVLVATAESPERLRLLTALHEAWYPDEDDL